MSYHVSFELNKEMEWNEMPIQIMNTFDPKMKKVFPHEYSKHLVHRLAL